MTVATDSVLLDKEGSEQTKQIDGLYLLSEHSIRFTFLRCVTTDLQIL